MDTLWKTHEFDAVDYSVFKAPKRQRSRVALGWAINEEDNSDNNALHWATFGNVKDWATWFDDKESLYDLEMPQKAASFLFFKRDVAPDNLPSDDANILQHIPVDEVSFRLIVDNFHIHRAFPILLENGAASFSRIPCKIGGRECKVYTLRVEEKMEKHTAITITYFPKTKDLESKMYALVLGLNDQEIIKAFGQLRAASGNLFSPFTLMKIFLELERNTRLKFVSDKVTLLETLVDIYGGLPVTMGRATPKPGTYDHRGDDSHGLLNLFLEVGYAKGGIAAWKAQLFGMKKSIKEFRAMSSPTSQEIDPSDYLSRLIEDYHVQIHKCDVLLQAIPLAFQRDTFHQSRLDTRQMKALALLTMVFLPGTFIAILMAVPEFEAMKNVRSLPPWSWYLALTLPLTAVVLVTYVLWVALGDDKWQKRFKTAWEKLNCGRRRGRRA
ncbi:uncharacterized protein LY89DRAFT_433164 [Mollisia scopiformis]|uniref:Uncharacterized protein n=1 Tax=Mollisia scopiformis TaxID=149040 RepID=A0A194XME3_MOLSC|nr:uncharacterized protein LY89DRAFT_433164 [Mollisia scopiformis]KUJ21420.1 hypothetical protein LY89DRAFT_433164 [Mollisia scopiformis]